VVVSAAAGAEIATHAAIEAEKLLRLMEDKCRAVLLNTLPMRAQKKVAPDANLLALQLGMSVRSILEETPLPLEFAGRRIRIADKEKYLRYQQEKATAPRDARKRLARQVKQPWYQEHLKKIADRAVRQRLQARANGWKRYIEGRQAYPPQRLSTPVKNSLLRTGKVMQYNRAMMKSAMETEEVVYLQFTTQRDSRVCAICDDHDLWTVKKADVALVFRVPPLHNNCRCYLIQITRQVAKKFGVRPTKKGDWPTEEPADGFGGIRQVWTAVRKKQGAA